MVTGAVRAYCARNRPMDQIQILGAPPAARALSDQPGSWYRETMDNASRVSILSRTAFSNQIEDLVREWFVKFLGPPWEIYIAPVRNIGSQLALKIYYLQLHLVLRAVEFHGTLECRKKHGSVEFSLGNMTV